jgi:hypothetical protein
MYVQYILDLYQHRVSTADHAKIYEFFQGLLLSF